MPTKPPNLCNRCHTPYVGWCRACTPHGWTGTGKPQSWAGGRSRAYRKLRAAKLRQSPLCQTCGALATQVDHILPLSQGGDRMAWANLQSLCPPCHAAKTEAESRQARGL